MLYITINVINAEKYQIFMGLEQKVDFTFDEVTEHKANIKMGEDRYEIILSIKNNQKTAWFKYYPRGNYTKNIYISASTNVTLGWLPNLIRYKKAWKRLNKFLLNPENGIQNKELLDYSYKALSNHLEAADHLKRK